MKKLFLISMSIAILSVTSNAQIEMNSSGEVGIGSTPVSGINLFTPEAKITKLGVNISPSSTIDLITPEAKISYLGVNTNPSTTYKLNTNGQVQFSYDIATSFKMTCYMGPYEMVFYPAVNNNNSLGFSNYAFKNVYAYNYPSPSDERYKENIENISGALNKILNLQGVTYDFKKEYSYDVNKVKDPVYIEKYENERKNKIGFIAQDINSVLPEVVFYDDSSDMYSIDYSKVVPVLVEAIKEQQTQISALENQVNSLTSLDPELKAASTNPEPLLDQLDISNELFQNVPNPFSETTIIKYQLKEGTSSATIYVYDMTGKQLRNYDISTSGKGELHIDGGELSSGVYLYSMVADGNLIGTKQMMLTD